MSAGVNFANFELRPATDADAATVRDLVFGVLHEYGLKPSPQDTDADLYDIDASYHQRGGRFDVLVGPAGAIVGSVGLFPVDRSTVELRKMYLHRDARGRGYGRRLLEHAVAEAKRLGFRRVTLETAFVLKEAVALYTRYGFRPYTPDHMSGRCDQAFELILPQEK